MKKIITIEFTYTDSKPFNKGECNGMVQMFHVLYRGIVTTFNWFTDCSFKIRDEE